MYCPNCKREFHISDITIEECFASEVEAVFHCTDCEEEYRICIAQEDLNNLVRD